MEYQKIAIVADAVYPYNKGGKEKRIYEVSTRLAQKGYDVTIYCMNWWNGNKVKIENNVKLIAISPYVPLYSGERRSIYQAIIFSFFCLKLLFYAFDVIDVDHMPHLVVFTTKIVSIIKRKKMIATWNEVWGKVYWMKYLKKFGFLAFIIEKMSVFLPAKIISISQHTTASLHSLGRKRQIYTIPLGVDVEAIKKITPAKKRYDVIFSGRLLKHKNINILIDAIEEIKKDNNNISCAIIGDGPEKQSLIKMIYEKKLDSNVFILPFFESQKRLYAYMKSAKIFAFPSTREGFGLVAIEANACGIPVITINSEHNAAKELIKDGANGKKIELDKKMLAKTIQDFLNRPLKKDKIFRSVQKYDWNKVVEQIEYVYKI